ncbi:MAG: TetR/AcrR family transcriptional regulator [Planctomycetes bacterium]|nr:TetR/AcrR family transcriptional regulator [Planctomycetota bacterium]
MQAKSKARHERYLAVAMQLFAEHGFVGASTDEIVARAGGSKATLYSLFPTKESLVTGLMDQLAAAMNRSTPEPALQSLPLREALTRIGLDALRGVTSERAVTLLRLALGEYNRFPELSATLWKHGPAITYANFRAFLKLRQKRGELDVDDTQLAAEHFFGSIVGHLQWKVAMGICKPPTPAEQKRRVVAAVKTFLARYAV